MECRLSSAIPSWWNRIGFARLSHILFYESGYSLHTLRQASRRSWRIGQRRPVRVKFLCYEGTMQTSCLRLMGKKLLVALTMEGKFAGEGLQSIDEDDDMLSAMARELVERNGIGETADSVWKALNAEHQKLFPTLRMATMQSYPSNCRASFWKLSLTPRASWKELWITASRRLRPATALLVSEAAARASSCPGTAVIIRLQLTQNTRRQSPRGPRQS